MYRLRMTMRDRSAYDGDGPDYQACGRTVLEALFNLERHLQAAGQGDDFDLMADPAVQEDADDLVQAVQAGATWLRADMGDPEGNFTIDTETTDDAAVFGRMMAEVEQATELAQRIYDAGRLAEETDDDVPVSPEMLANHVQAITLLRSFRDGGHDVPPLSWAPAVRQILGDYDRLDAAERADYRAEMEAATPSERADMEPPPQGQSFRVNLGGLGIGDGEQVDLNFEDGTATVTDRDGDVRVVPGAVTSIPTIAPEDIPEDARERALREGPLPTIDGVSWMVTGQDGAVRMTAAGPRAGQVDRNGNSFTQEAIDRSVEEFNARREPLPEAEVLGTSPILPGDNPQPGRQAQERLAAGAASGMPPLAQNHLAALILLRRMEQSGLLDNGEDWIEDAGQIHAEATRLDVTVNFTENGLLAQYPQPRSEPPHPNHVAALAALHAISQRRAPDSHVDALADPVIDQALYLGFGFTLGEFPHPSSVNVDPERWPARPVASPTEGDERALLLNALSNLRSLRLYYQTSPAMSDEALARMRETYTEAVEILAEADRLGFGEVPPTGPNRGGDGFAAAVAPDTRSLRLRVNHQNALALADHVRGLNPNNTVMEELVARAMEVYVHAMNLDVSVNRSQRLDTTHPIAETDLVPGLRAAAPGMRAPTAEPAAAAIENALGENHLTCLAILARIMGNPSFAAVSIAQGEASRAVNEARRLGVNVHVLANGAVEVAGPGGVNRGRGTRTSLRRRTARPATPPARFAGDPVHENERPITLE